MFAVNNETPAGQYASGGAIPLVQSGTSSIDCVANTPTFVDVLFDKPFSTPPAILVTANSGVPGTQVLECSYTAATVNGFRAWMTRTTNTTTGFSWTAVAPA